MSALLPARAQPVTASANPNAGANPKAILAYIQSLPARSSHKVLSGQWAGYGPAATLADLQTIANQTGHWPAFVGVSYTDYSTNGISPAIPNQIATAYWNNGGLVEVDCHFATSPNGGGLSDPTVNLIACITPGTAANLAWLQMLNQVAAGLQQLQQSGVTVIWRPLHEMNGTYFWWAGKPPADFIQFWQFMFNYFTVTKGLNNLLWAYGPAIGSNTATYYPGSNFVDLVGFSAYGNAIDPVDFAGYPALVALGKPFGFCEFGPGSPNTPPTGNFDYSQFIAGVKASFPLTTFFMAWNSTWSPANNLNASGLFNDPWLINRDTLATDLFANTSRLSNFSALGAVGAATPVTLGFAVSGNGNEGVLARGVGPGLASFGVSGALANPQLQMFSGTTVMGSNAGWGGGAVLQNLFAQVGAFALSPASKDAALAVTLPVGLYTVRLTPAAAGTGTALAELYDTTATANLGTAPRFVNLSALASVGGSPLTVGFTVTGVGPKRVLVRAIGPTLSQYGVSAVLANPQLQLFQGQAVMDTNSGWNGDPALAASFAQVGAFALPSGSLDAAVQVTLGPGSYTVAVSGVGANATGTVLVELYELP